MPRLSRLSFVDAGAALVAFCMVCTVSVALAAASDLVASPAAKSVMIMPPAGMAADPIAQPVTMPADPGAAAIIQRGEYLATAGDCQYCHSIPGGTPYAGGQPLQTPFGAMFSPNITPDKNHGIGGWTDAQFYRVMHEGISPGNSLLVFPRYLYPVMPWQDYSKLSYADDMAIKAYLNSLPAASAPSRPSEIMFPFNIRAGLLSLRLISPSLQPMQYDPSWSPQVRNGAFLVDALAHCGECHTPRNLLTITQSSRLLSGANIPAQSWYAPNITSDKTAGTGGWNSSDLFGFLYHSGALGIAGGPYGPMKAVVEDSLSRLPASDVQDIVAYLQTVPGKPDAPAGKTVADSAAGGPLYSTYCARCHGDNGQGVSNNFPNLAGNQSVWSGPGNNVISMVLGGYLPWHANQSAMPEFNQTLSNDEIAAITNYIRTAWGNKGTADATATLVGRERGVASDWSMLSTATTQAGVTMGGAQQRFNDISGQVELFGDRTHCMLNGSFTTDNSAAAVKSVILAGTCAKSGSAFQGTMTIDGTPHQVNLLFQEFVSGGHLSTLRLSGTPEGTNLFFDARINLREPAA